MLSWLHPQHSSMDIEVPKGQGPSAERRRLGNRVGEPGLVGSPKWAESAATEESEVGWTEGEWVLEG